MTREKLVRIVERYKLIIKFQPEETNVKERETHTDGHVITHWHTLHTRCVSVCKPAVPSGGWTMLVPIYSNIGENQ